MMKVKNRYTSAIGFRNITVLPDGVAELPEEINRTHPVLTYYIERGWIEFVEDDATQGEASSTKEKDISGKPVDKLKLEELRALAAELGLEYTEDDTRAVLIDRIKTAEMA
ncbi:MAG: hypothetical protein LBS67_01830 [Clostridiales Family XIII bacterium]|jgi:hypothetical protein|nr:hypothetical protein [Clostridiales Family XIII bacterium]